MDPQEFAKVGAELVEIGNALKDLKEERANLDLQITVLEKKLRPLVTQHAKFIAELVGEVAPPDPASGPLSLESGPVDNTALKKRILAFVARSEPGVGPLEIADAIKVDPVLVRQVMMEMRNSG